MAREPSRTLPSNCTSGCVCRVHQNIPVTEVILGVCFHTRARKHIQLTAFSFLRWCAQSNVNRKYALWSDIPKVEGVVARVLELLDDLLAGPLKLDLREVYDAGRLVAQHHERVR